MALERTIEQEVSGQQASRFCISACCILKVIYSTPSQKLEALQVYFAHVTMGGRAPPQLFSLPSQLSIFPLPNSFHSLHNSQYFPSPTFLPTPLYSILFYSLPFPKSLSSLPQKKPLPSLPPSHIPSPSSPLRHQFSAPLRPQHSSSRR